MTPKEAWAAQIADVKAHMGELHSVDGKSVERLLADRAAELTQGTIERAKARIAERIAAGMQMGGAGPEDAQNVQDFAAEQARVMALTDGE